VEQGEVANAMRVGKQRLARAGAAKRVIVVGAGLAGLTAAINLARDGFRVLVYEAQPRIGGRADFRPDPAGSPFGLKQLEAYTGIDISPSVQLLRECRYFLWGKSYTLAFPRTVTCYMVERGSRASSLDSLLYEIARREGVEVVFGRKFSTREEFEALPPGSILATGLERATYQLLGLPHETSYAYCARGSSSSSEATVSIYMGPFTTDYGFSCTINGVAFAFVYQRGTPLSEGAKHAFRAHVEAAEPTFTLGAWHDLEFGACPSGSFRNPRLFWNDKILAGSLGGSIDPLLNFGMLGAMLSGRIAAWAVVEPRVAAREFRRLNVSFYPLLCARRALVRMPDPWRAAVAQSFLGAYASMPAVLQRIPYLFVPGYGRMG